MAELPTFRYHPEPLVTGSVKPSDAVCVACGDARGYIYTGPVFSVEEIDEGICPWCIADGSAADRFDAMFTDDLAPADVADGIVEIISRRTPGFTGWQQEHWLYHCGDGAAFLGVVGWRELEAHPPVVDSLRHQLAELKWSPEQGDAYLQALEKTGSPSAYLFQCLHCGTYLAYSDSD